MPDLTDQHFAFRETEHEKYLLLVLLAALVLRLVSIFHFTLVPSSDALDYHRIAMSVVEGTGYSLNGQPTAFRPPGFTLWLAFIYILTNNNVVAAQVVQAGLETLQCCLIYLLGRRLLSGSVGLTAAIVWSIYPASIIHSNLLFSEPLFNCLFLAGLVLLTSAKGRAVSGLAVVGVLWGWASLIKPLFFIAPIILIVWMVWNSTPLKDALRAAIIVAVPMICLAAPWVIRNSSVLHSSTLATHGGINLWIGNNENATGGYRFDEDTSPFAGITDEVERNKIGYSSAVQFIASRPLQFLLLLPKKVAFLFSSDSPSAILLHSSTTEGTTASYSTIYRRTPVALHLAFNLPYATIMLLGILGIVGWPGEQRESVRLFLIVIGYWIIVHAVFYATQRYRYPLMPFFTLAAAYAIVHFESVRENLKGGRRGACFALMVGFVAILVAEIATAIFAGVE